nr:hypothetical protein [Curtobacterium sp. MCBD17_021]
MPSKARQQERADPAVSDEHDAVLRSLRREAPDRTLDPVLSVDGPFPPADGSLRLREERVDGRFELARVEVAGRAAVPLAEVLVDLELRAPMPGDDLGGVQGLPLAAADDAEGLREQRRDACGAGPSDR